MYTILKTLTILVTGSLYSVLAVIVTITERSIYSANSYCDTNDNNGQVWMCGVNGYCDTNGKVYMRY